MRHDVSFKKKSRSVSCPRMVAELWSKQQWKSLRRGLQQLETQVGQQRAVTERQQDQLMHQQTTIDADRAARTPVTPIAQEAEVGNKPKTFTGETHEWTGWSFKMRQYISRLMRNSMWNLWMRKRIRRENCPCLE